jgi:putative tricarboxylic transport membrane protein
VTRVWQTVDALLVVFGALVVYLSHTLRYRTEQGPGPGFFGVWLGLLLVVLAVTDAAQSQRRPDKTLPDGFLPDRSGLRRFLVVFVALAASSLLLTSLGFSLAMFLFAVVLLRALATGQPWWLTMVIALAGSFGTAFVFRLLMVPLPTGLLGI